jgi:hypothetical protein
MNTWIFRKDETNSMYMGLTMKKAKLTIGHRMIAVQCGETFIVSLNTSIIAKAIALLVEVR